MKTREFIKDFFKDYSEFKFFSNFAIVEIGTSVILKIALHVANNSGFCNGFTVRVCSSKTPELDNSVFLFEDYFEVKNAIAQNGSNDNFLVEHIDGHMGWLNLVPSKNDIDTLIKDIKDYGKVFSRF